MKSCFNSVNIIYIFSSLHEHSVSFILWKFIFLSFLFQCPLQAWWERPPDFLAAQQLEHILPPSHLSYHDNS